LPEINTLGIQIKIMVRYRQKRKTDTGLNGRKCHADQQLFLICLANYATF